MNKKTLIRTGMVFLFAWLVVLGCNSTDKNTPLGPSVSSPTAMKVVVTPVTPTVNKKDSITFAAAGGSASYTWALNNPNLGFINSTTGAFTAGNSSGAVLVTATDSRGATGSATVTISGAGIVVVPASTSLTRGASQTFTASGTAPFFWSLNNSLIGTIGTSTGIFTAFNTLGTSLIFVTDSAGNTGSATVTVIDSPLVVTPGTLSLSVLPGQTVPYTATGLIGTGYWSLSGATNGYAGTTINTLTGVLTITSMPTIAAAQGTQALTINVTDGTGRSGTATLYLIAS